jgi:hypothetical protein
VKTEIFRSEGYLPDFDIDVRRGKVGEDFTADLLEAIDTVEVKTDYRAHETGNVYIEVWSYRRSDLKDIKPSGISTTKAKYWAFATPENVGLLIISTDELKKLVKSVYHTHKASQPVSSAKTAASIGVKLPVRLIMERIGLESKRN